MTIKTAAELFIQASQEGFILDMQDNARCTDECSICPAEPACKEFGGNYIRFTINFQWLILPEIELI